MKKRFLVLLLLVAMILAMVPPQTVQAAEKGRLAEDEYGNKYYIYGNGHDEWAKYRVNIDGKWYDYGGGWQQIDGKWYFFDEEGGQAYRSSEWDPTGINQIYGKNYAFDENGVMKSNCWIKSEWSDSEWFYAGADGTLAGAGWKKIGGKWYYFEEFGISYGAVRTGARVMSIDGVRYAFDSNGALSSGGWVESKWEYYDVDEVLRSSSEWYYANSDGTLFEGWKYSGGKWYYFLPVAGYMTYGGGRKIGGQYYVFDKNGALAGAGWVDLGNGRWGYADANGKPVQGWKKSGNDWYYILESGSAATTFAIADKTLNFFKENGVWESAYKTPGWKSVKIGDNTYWFYINPDGTAATGWKSINGKWYFFYEKTGAMAASGATEIDGKRYLFDKNGNLITKVGWHAEKSTYGDSEYTTWYYLNSDGSLRTGWQNIGGKRYYFGDYGSMYGGERAEVWELEDGLKYLFAADGSLVTEAGWYAVKYTYDDYEYTTWYYLNADGTVRTGWQNIGGKWYYFGEYGEMRGGNYAGTYSINGVRYYFDESGAMRTGWIKETNEWTDAEGNNHSHSQWYYADGSGSVAIGEKTIGGKKYLFSEYGALRTNDWGTGARYKGIQYTLNEGEVVKSFNYQALYE